jgi:hypothetical protein
MLKRKSRTEIANVSVGIKGTRIKSMFEGRCVNTIIFTSPNRLARREAPNAEIPSNVFAPKIGTQAYWIHTKRQVKPIGSKALDDESASKRIERKQRLEFKGNVA